jgi:hypothetical protein
VASTPGLDVSRATVHQPTLRLITYALPSLVSSVAALPLALFVPAFYPDDLGVPLAAVGMAIAASRLLDVVTGPLIGIASDRLPLCWGRPPSGRRQSGLPSHGRLRHLLRACARRPHPVGGRRSEQRDAGARRASP